MLFVSHHIIKIFRQKNLRTDYHDPLRLSRRSRTCIGSSVVPRGIREYLYVCNPSSGGGLFAFRATNEAGKKSTNRNFLIYRYVLYSNFLALNRRYFSEKNFRQMCSGPKGYSLLTICDKNIARVKGIGTICHSLYVMKCQRDLGAGVVVFSKPSSKKVICCTREVGSQSGGIL